MGILDELKKNDLLARIRQTYPGAADTASGTAVVVTTDTDTETTHAAPSDSNSKRPEARSEARPFVVAAVFDPPSFRGTVDIAPDPGGWSFDDSLSQSERRETIETAAWFDRQDARKKRATETDENFRNENQPSNPKGTP